MTPKKTFMQTSCAKKCFRTKWIQKCLQNNLFWVCKNWTTISAVTIIKSANSILPTESDIICSDCSINLRCFNGRPSKRVLDVKTFFVIESWWFGIDFDCFYYKLIFAKTIFLTFFKKRKLQKHFKRIKIAKL